MPEGKGLWQLQVSDAVQRVLGMPNGPVGDLVKKCSLQCVRQLFNSLHVSCIFFYSQLMTKEPLEKLGFKDLKYSSPKQADGNTKLWQPAVKGGVTPMWQVNQCFNWLNHKDCCMKNNCYNENIAVLTGAFKANVGWKLFCK